MVWSVRSPRDCGPGEHTRLACGAVRPRAAQGVGFERPPAGAPVATAEAAVVPESLQKLSTRSSTSLGPFAPSSLGL